MFRIAGRLQLMASTRAVQTITAVGLHAELEPIWPLPLPPALEASGKAKNTLVLDIDETLIHTYHHSITRFDKPGSPHNGMPLCNYQLAVRPFLKEFLTEVNELFELVFWTAGTASYCAAILDAIERQILGLPISFYATDSILSDIGDNKHANFYALSRRQTLQDAQYMKYIPMLGRPESRVLIIDDNERSFPLTPRQGIKVPCFEASSNAQSSDNALLQLMPLLRAAAASPDVSAELDYWRSDEYVACDNFQETMNTSSYARQRLLGFVDLSTRRNTPIPPLKMHVFNNGYLEAAKTSMKYTMSPPRSRM